MKLNIAAHVGKRISPNLRSQQCALCCAQTVSRSRTYVVINEAVHGQTLPCLIQRWSVGRSLFDISQAQLFLNKNPVIALDILQLL